MIATLDHRPDRRLARYLTVWWIASVLVDVWWAGEMLPVDIEFSWLSMAGLEILTFIGGIAVLQGLVFGGWKVLLVAAGRSSIRTTTDKVWIGAFVLLTLWWPAMMVVQAFQSGLA